MCISMMRIFRAPLIAAVAAVTLSGCIGLGGKTPPFLLTLDPVAEPPAGAARTAAEAATLTILIPTAPQKLRPTRDRQCVAKGKSVSVRVDLGGRRVIKHKNKRQHTSSKQIMHTNHRKTA